MAQLNLARPQRPRVYDHATGVVVTTTAKLHLEVSVTIDGVTRKFSGDAEGIFPQSTTPLQHAKIATGTVDVDDLINRSKLFTFNAKSSGFLVAFYDEDFVLLGKLTAAPIGITDRAGGPGSGSWEE